MSLEQERSHGHYVHRLTYSARERLVGAFILCAVLFLLALIGMNEKTLLLFETKHEYHVYFSSAKGLSTDTLVKVSGLEVGKVASLNLVDNNKIHATIHIYDRYGHLIRVGSEARLNRLAVIGTATIEINAGSPENRVLPEGAIIPAKETPSLDDLIEGLAYLVNMDDTGSTTSMLTELSIAIDNLKTVTGRIRSGEGALGTLIYGEEFHDNLSSAVAHLDHVMTTASDSVTGIKPLIADTRAVVRDVRDATEKLPNVVATANDAAIKIDTALTVLNAELQQFPDVLVRLNLVLEEATRVLEAMQRVWPISSAVRPKGEQQLIKVQPVNE